MASKILPSKEELCDLFDYNSETGVVTWRARPAWMFPSTRNTKEHNANKWNGKCAGKPIETRLRTGHMYTSINRSKVLLHRIIWKMVYGEEPDTIDHINGDPSDNRLVNLRSVPQGDNARNIKLKKNNTSGHMGVYFDKRRKMWVSRIHHGHNRHLGHYNTYEEAVQVRKEAERRYWFHENHGRAA